MQRILIRFVLNPLSKLTANTSQKCRDTLFLIFGSGLFLYAFLYHMHVIQWRYMYSYAICCALLGLVIVVTLPKQIKPVKFRPLFALCWFGVGGLMLLSAFRNNTNYLPEALLISVAYPVIYISWSNDDATHRFRMLLKLCRYSYIVFLAASFLLIQISTRRYGGIFYNVNNGASYLALAGTCLMLEMLYDAKSIKRNCVNILLFGICYGMIELSNSRSGKLALLCAVVVGCAMYLLTNRTRIQKKVIVNMVCCVLVSSVISGGLLYVLQLRQYLPLPYFNEKTQTFYMSDYWIKKFEKIKEKPILRPAVPTETTAPTNPGLLPFEPDEGYVESTTEPTLDPDEELEFFDSESYDNFRDNKTSTDGKTLDQISTGRISIWKGFLERLTLFGVAEKEPLYVESYGRAYNTTHMTILEIAYESGIFAGIFYFLVNLISGILAIVYAYKKRNHLYALMPLMVILQFGVASVLTSFTYSFNYLPTLYYYLVLFPLITCGPKKTVAA